MDRAKSCPFCGAIPLITVTPISHQFQLFCNSCGCTRMGRFFDTVDEAVDHWNQRDGVKENDMPV